jgi:hypothetical protein
MRQEGVIKITNWVEKTFKELGGSEKLTHATVSQTVDGFCQASADVEYVMVYLADGSASYAGLQYMEGTLDNKKGAFALRVRGTYKDGVADVEWDIVPGSGKGELKGISGVGGMPAAGHGRTQKYFLDYEFKTNE